MPLKHIELDTQRFDDTPNQDMMAQLVGNWYYSAGGSMGPDHITMNADGTFIANGSSTGTWYVRDYHSGWNLYWDEVPCELVLIYDEGMVNIKGLKLRENETDASFSLLNWEGSGGYSPADEPYVAGEHG